MTDNYLLGSAVRAFSGHEFRTPMTAIIGLANIMHETAGKISVEEQKELTHHILTSAQHLMNASLRVSTWYELTNNRIENKEMFTVTADQLLQMVKDSGESQLCTGEFFSFHQGTEKLYISGNEMVLVMALKELFNNAFKFAKKGTVVSFSVLEENRHYKIIIKNISDKVKSFDFDKYTVFTQFDRHFYEQQGLGLGLEIARLGITLCQGTYTMSATVANDDNFNVRCEINLPVPE
ncbi:sensor histidine kinase [Sediminibacterium goheungense]|uniref:histidine kinase n=1 Tax=Sediminibacterium goheungense TaxID=1086393 RepID=A0A4R6IX94_9BACT|nr:histidine kinase dimerization/phospho-acceptor domain-containing protein [Sediminibacterium goheungense]TDO27027.1 hypothetical protein BC659_2343 [Sediminibacterium goheungense]